METFLEGLIRRLIAPATLFFGLVLTVFLFLHATRPIFDSDFWWHLKTGQVMFEQKGLLSSDPFSLETSSEPSLREGIILKGYWLWQVVAYGFYDRFGFDGIFLLNFLTVGALAATLVYRFQRYSISWGLSAPLIGLAFLLLGGYALERPQVVSFLFATILMGLLLEVRENGRLGWTLPVTMIFWANLHGGFVVGVVMLCCFAAGVVVEYRHDLSRMRSLLLWSLAGIAASLLNPSGFWVYVFLFNFVGKPIQTGIIEYKTTWAAFNDGTHVVAILWLLILLYGIGLCLARKIYWPEILVGLFLAFLSVRYLRNVAFFSFAMLPAIGLAWRDAARQRHWELPSISGLIGVGTAGLALLWLVSGQWQHRRGDVKVEPIYPEAAIQFLVDSGLQGRMFNSYEYGGYLLWRLSPRIKVFIDGRGINELIYDHHEKIRLASNSLVEGHKEYEYLLNSYKIDYIIQPIYDGYGNVQPLMKVILANEEWLPIYLDRQVYILVRRNDKNSDIVNNFLIDKNEFKARLLSIYAFLQSSNPGEVGYKVAYADMLIYLGRYNDAVAAIDAIALQSPSEKMLPHLRRQLHMLAGQIMRSRGQ